MKKIVCSLLAGGLLLGALTGCGQETESKIPVTLNEVAHSIFYAPQYAAIELGYFEEEGIDLTLVNGNGADKVMTALISGDADIGFMGSEASIYTYAEGAEDYGVNFAQLTQRAGNFLVGRKPEADFKWENLLGTKVLGGRAGGMPQMVFEYILKKNGIDPKTDLTIDQSISFGLTAAAFTNDDSDYTVEFEPFATSLEEPAMWWLLWEQIPAMFPIPPTARKRATWNKTRKLSKNLPMRFKRDWITSIPIRRKKLPKPSSRSLKRQRSIPSPQS